MHHRSCSGTGPGCASPEPYRGLFAASVLGPQVLTGSGFGWRWLVGGSTLVSVKDSGWLQALTVCLVLGAAISGYAAPALELRRNDRLTARSLFAQYRQLSRLIPQAFWVALRGAVRHPWDWDGPIFGWVLMVGMLFVFSIGGVFEIAFGDERSFARWATPLALFAAVGCGLELVRDTRRYVEEDDEANPR
jgi:hypothetical protein